MINGNNYVLNSYMDYMEYFVIRAVNHTTKETYFVVTTIPIQEINKCDFIRRSGAIQHWNTGNNFIELEKITSFSNEKTAIRCIADLEQTNNEYGFKNIVRNENVNSILYII
jgi:hypothetical protein